MSSKIHVLVYKSIQESARVYKVCKGTVYKNIQKCTRVCKSVQECRRVCTSVQECTRVCKSVQESARVYKSMQECTRVCKSVQEYARVYKSMQECTRVCKSVEEYARVYKSVQECTRVILSHSNLSNSNQTEMGGGEEDRPIKSSSLPVSLVSSLLTMAMCWRGCVQLGCRHRQSRLRQHIAIVKRNKTRLTGSDEFLIGLSSSPPPISV